MNRMRPYPSDGLGLMHIKLSPKVDNLNLSITVGHGGADWGSIALINGFNPRFNFSFVLGVNSVTGMNCTATSTSLRVWALYHPTHAVYCALLGYHAYWMLIGACDPML